MAEVLEKRSQRAREEEGQGVDASVNSSSSSLPPPPSAGLSRLGDGGESSGSEEESQSQDGGGAIVYECDNKCGYRGSFADVAAHERHCRARVGKLSAPWSWCTSASAQWGRHRHRISLCFFAPSPLLCMLWLRPSPFCAHHHSHRASALSTLASQGRCVVAGRASACRKCRATHSRRGAAASAVASCAGEQGARRALS